MNNNNFDMAKIMAMISKMDKKDLEAGLAQANKILQNKNQNSSTNNFNNKNSNN